MVVRKILFFITLMLLLNTSLAFLDITPVEQVYNYGDEIISTLTINPSSTEGNFDYSLFCDGQKETIIFYKGASSYFSIGKEIKLDTKIKIEREYIGNLSGNCYLKVSLGGESVSSQNFKITNLININHKLNKIFFDPGETAVLELYAIKENGQKFTGFVKGEGIFNFEKAVTEGYVKEVFSISPTLEAGDYQINLFFYDLGMDGKVNNFNNYSVNFKINQVPKSVPLTISSVEIEPGENLYFKAELFDQSGKPMEGAINVELISPEKNIVARKTIWSGEEAYFSFETNAQYGKWILSSSFGKLKEEREVEVKKKPLLSFNFFENSSVFSIKNIGNYLFSGDISIFISNETKNLSLNIKPNEERRFTLSAPRGEHAVKIKTGDGKEFERNFFLTGKVVEVKEYNGSFFTNYFYIIVFFFILFLIAGLILFFKKRNRTINLKESLLTKKLSNTGHKEILQIKKQDSGDASFSLVLKGEKESVVIIFLKIKNQLKPHLADKLREIIKTINKFNAVIDEKDNEFLIIFSPKKTRSFKNEYNAIRMALQVSLAIKEINKKFVDKINFGIFIHSGEIISSFEKGKFLYTPIDNIIPFGRKMADKYSLGDVFISEKIKSKLIREVKVEKINQDGESFYKIKEIIDKDLNEKKLQDILKRFSNDQ